ncbi:unnamed protein product [Sympodiomycopsis kandeliae]
MPRERKQFRACLGCNLVQSARDFVTHGCPNCGDRLDMQQDGRRVAQCTTAVFDGMIAMGKPEQSWVAKWQRIEKRAPGLYAVKVSGRLMEEDRERLGIRVEAS